VAEFAISLGSEDAAVVGRRAVAALGLLAYCPPGKKKGRLTSAARRQVTAEECRRLPPDQAWCRGLRRE